MQVAASMGLFVSSLVELRAESCQWLHLLLLFAAWMDLDDARRILHLTCQYILQGDASSSNSSQGLPLVWKDRQSQRLCQCPR